MIKSKFNIVLYEPEIPQNTGNIVRLCACSGSDLFLVGKLGFSLSDKYLKRAGLDYWNDVNIKKYENLQFVIADFPDSKFYYLTTKSKKIYTDIMFNSGDFLVFGPETRGIPETILNANSEYAVTIPMKEGQRNNIEYAVTIHM